MEDKPSNEVVFLTFLAEGDGIAYAPSGNTSEVAFVFFGLPDVP